VPESNSNPDIVKSSTVVSPFKRNTSTVTSLSGSIVTDLMPAPLTVTPTGTVNGSASE